MARQGRPGDDHDVTPAPPEGGDEPVPRRRFARVLVVTAAVLAGTAGVAMVLIALAVGHCSAFGGTCPATPEPLLDDDVFRFVAAGTALAVVPAVAVMATTWRQRLRRVAVALPVCVVLGALAADWAAG